jgi:HTH-type transcriptional regulator / antitoxin HigA
MRNTTKTTGKKTASVQRIAHAFCIASVEDEAHYNQYCQIIDALFTLTQGDDTHPLTPIIDLFGEAVETYEEQRFTPIATNDPIAVLKTLMDQHDLTQRDLPELGNQAKVSEILNGKRPLNKKHIEALCKRFQISPNLFF